MKRSLTKLLSLMLVLVMFVSLVPMSALAGDEETEEIPEVTEPAPEAEEPAEPEETPALPEETPEPEEKEEELPISEEDDEEEPAPEEEELPAPEELELSLEGENILTAANFPDANFLAFLNSKYPDGLTAEQAAAVTELDVTELNISNLTGIGFFTGLKTLKCSRNSLLALDVSANTALEDLNCVRNNITSLDVSANTTLKKLNCAENNITSLDVSANTALTWLDCCYNSIASLDLSANSQLETLYCHYNSLTSLKVSSCAALGTLNCSYNSALKELDCYGLKLVTFNVIHCDALEKLDCASNKLTTLSLSGLTALKELDCGGNSIVTLSYLSDCTALTELNCAENSLSSLSLSANTALKALDCSDNSLTSLDVSSHTSLTCLACGSESLTALDVSGCTALEKLYCDGCTALTSLSCSNLSLTALDVSGCTALKELVCSINGITTFNVSGCAALEKLICFDNSLTVLDVSGLTALKELSCEENSLVSLNVSGCTALNTLYCQKNSLTSLDVSSCTALKELLCQENGTMTSLNVSGCTALTLLNCSHCCLTSLNVSGCTALKELVCSINGITALDVSSSAKLEELNCFDNSLTSLNVSGLTALKKLNCSENSIASLNITGCTALTVLDCRAQDITGFRGWASSQQRADKGRVDYDGYTGLPSFGMLYAVTNPEISYTIRFNANGGTGKMANISAEGGSFVTLPANAFKKTHFTFLQWNTKADDTGTAYADNATVKDLTVLDGAVVTLYAQWVPNTYTVHFDPNGADGVMEDMLFIYGTAQNLTPCAFTRAGYTFTGWKLGSTVYKDGQSVKNLTSANGVTVTLTAQWKANTGYEGYKYTIHFNGNGNTSGKMSNLAMKVGTAKALLANGFRKTGYHLAGWAVEPDGAVMYTNKQKVKDLNIDLNPDPYGAAVNIVELYAVWEKNNYTVIFSGNGGKYDTLTKYSQSAFLTYDEPFELDANKFTRTGYTFVGWCANRSGKGEIYGDRYSVLDAGLGGLTAKQNGKVTLYAIWSANPYTIHFDMGTAVSGSMEDSARVYGKAARLPANAFSKPGYSFAYWTDSSGKIYKNRASVKNLTAEYDGIVTLTANWTANTYYVKFAANGGTGLAPAKLKGYGDTQLEIPENTFKRTGRVFREWNTKKDGTGTTYMPGQTVVFDTKNKVTVTLYAIWDYTP